MKFIFLISLFLFSSVHPDDKTVLISILARNKAHTLPRYLKCIENLNYDKKLITVYINTNNNEDKTLEILEEWTEKYHDSYRNILFEKHHIENNPDTTPHVWPKERLQILAEIRNKSLKKAQEENCDYYFVVDCDNFIAPETLKVLMSKDKPIIAPLLRSIPEVDDRYSNFFYDVDERGYYKSNPEYLKILYNWKRGTYKVPVVHCSYLIQTKFIDLLNYTDNSYDYEFIIFSRNARKNLVDQYICNEIDFGVQIHYNEKFTLEEEKRRIKNILLLP